jgi:hypothetical protein
MTESRRAVSLLKYTLQFALHLRISTKHLSHILCSIYACVPGQKFTFIEFRWHVLRLVYFDVILHHHVANVFQKYS